MYSSGLFNLRKKVQLLQPAAACLILLLFILFGTNAQAQVPKGVKTRPSEIETSAVTDRFPGGFAPVIGAWFPDSMAIADPEGYRAYIDVFAKFSSYSLITTTMRTPLRNGAKQMVDKDIHDWFKNAVEYAGSKGIKIALELDPRHSTGAFAKKYPHELQQRLWLKKFKVGDRSDWTEKITYNLEHGDAITSVGTNAVDLVKVYSFTSGRNGIESLGIKDITNACTVNASGKNFLVVNISKAAGDKNQEVCVITRVTLNYPDVYSPHLISFELETMRQYADMPLAGVLKDEFGFPACHDGNSDKNGFWYSPALSAAYKKSTGGRDMVRDAMLMFAGEKGKERERQMAVNHLMELYRKRCTAVEQAFYRNAKSIFGDRSFAGTHATVFPMPNAQEFERNGFDWFTATRDYAQADETTPYALVVAMSKKFSEPVWYNQYYAPNINEYEKNIWRYATLGGRMNFHQLYPTNSDSWLEDIKGILKGDMKRGDCRIRLLNLISKAPVDCPVAVIFGHTNAMNWAGHNFEDVGLALADLCWRAGYYADLIPGSEIAGKSLSVDDQGYVWFGKQKYAAVVLYQPEFENPGTAAFFKKAENKGSLLYKVGGWTKDFNANYFDGDAALPDRMLKFSDYKGCGKVLLDDLNRKYKSLLQIPVTDTMPSKDMLGRSFVPSFAPSEQGITRLTDGTTIILSGKDNAAGDTIIKTIKVKGIDVFFNVIGVGGVRLSKDGTVEAIAGGGLKSFKSADFSITMAERVDMVLLREKGEWRGYWQGLNTAIPDELLAITAHWTRIGLPVNLNFTAY
jgi:hypothetical protein